MPDYLVTITRTLTIFGAARASDAAALALTSEANPGPTQNRLGAIVLRIDVERWETELTRDA